MFYRKLLLMLTVQQARGFVMGKWNQLAFTQLPSYYSAS